MTLASFCLGNNPFFVVSPFHFIINNPLFLLSWLKKNNNNNNQLCCTVVLFFPINEIWSCRSQLWLRFRYLSSLPSPHLYLICPSMQQWWGNGDLFVFFNKNISRFINQIACQTKEQNWYRKDLGYGHWKQPSLSSLPFSLYCLYLLIVCRQTMFLDILTIMTDFGTSVRASVWVTVLSFNL